MFHPCTISAFASSSSSYLQEWLRRGSECHTSWWYCPWSSGDSAVAPAAWCCAQSRGQRALLPASPQPSCSPSIGQTPCRTSEYTVGLTKYTGSIWIRLEHQWEWIKWINSPQSITEPLILSPVCKKKKKAWYIFFALTVPSFSTIL